MRLAQRSTSGGEHRGSGAHQQSRRSGRTSAPTGPVEAVADKGYHSNDTLTVLKDAEVRTYISEPDRGRRRWEDKPEAQAAVYANRRRIQGEHGKRLLRQRGELLERSFAHAYETGGMRRVYLRGRDNVLKRVLIHVGALNLSLVMRKLLGQRQEKEMQAQPTRSCQPEAGAGCRSSGNEEYAWWKET